MSEYFNQINITEVGLFAVAAIVIFLLYRAFQEYLKNPIPELKRDAIKDKAQSKPRDISYIAPTPEDRLMVSEYGLIIRILGKLDSLENRNIALSNTLIQNIIDDMVQEGKYTKEMFLNLFNNAKNDNIDNLAELFNAATKGEYKKRLKLIEFMFVCAYADENLGNHELDEITEVASILQIDNEDFNNIVEEFAQAHNSSIMLTRMQALMIMNLNHGFTKDELNDSFNTLVKKHNQNITDHKILEKSLAKYSSSSLREVNAAYNLLLKELKEQK